MDLGKAAFRAAISYAHGRYDAEIRQLADRLNCEGVDCELDLYNEAPPQGWPQWIIDTMMDRVVLLVCTPEYAERLSGASAKGVGRGVAFEGRLLRQRVYDDQGRNEGVVPLIFDHTEAQFIPPFLRDVAYYDLSATDGYDNLYRRLTRQPRYVKPALGAIKVMPPVQPAPEPQVPSKPPRSSDVSIRRLGFGPYADALKFSHVGASASVLYDTQSIDFFDRSDDHKIGAFARSLPEWAGLREAEVPEGVILSDRPEASAADFGYAENAMHVTLDGSVTLRSRLIGAHFLYDIERVLATLFAMCRFMQNTYNTYPLYNANFGYRLVEHPYPRNISMQPYNGHFRIDVRQEFPETMVLPILQWSRSAWPIALTKEEVADELARFWNEHFST